jgi:hypothetical protein
MYNKEYNPKDYLLIDLAAFDLPRPVPKYQNITEANLPI